MPIAPDIAELLDRGWAFRDQRTEAPLRQLLGRLSPEAEPETVAMCCLALATLATARNEPAVAGELLDRGIAVVGDTDRLVLARLLNARGALFLEQDLWPEAIGPLIAVSRMSADFPWEALRARQNLAFCSLGLRDHAGALARFRECLPLSTGSGGLHAFFPYGMALAAMRGGDRAGAHEHLDALFALRDPEGRPGDRILAKWHAASAELAAIEERWTAVVHHVGEAMQLPAAIGLSAQGTLTRLASCAAEALGDRDGARRAIGEALALPLGPIERVDLLRQAAEIARRDGDHDAAFRYHHEAVTSSRDDGASVRAVVDGLERAAEGIELRDLELSSANEALRRAYASLDQLRRQLEDRVEERTRALEAEVEVRRRAEEAAVRSNRTKSRFLANMSHELRTPLNAIIGYAELLAEDLPPSSASDAGAIRGSGLHLLSMVDEILDLTRIEAGYLEVRLEPVALGPFLDALVHEVAPVIRAGGNRLVREGDPSGPPFVTDPLRLRQILTNLLGNAAKFTEGGTVTLGLRRTGPRVDLWVSDTGIGIDPAQLPRLFEPFEQIDSTSTRQHGGAGLGLSICREVARVLGGEVTAESALGLGSRFAVSLTDRSAAGEDPTAS